MAHVEDRWFKTIEVDDEEVRVKTDLHGKGLRYRARYTTPDGKERSKSFPDRQLREAKAFLTSVEGDKLKGAYVDPTAGRILFREYATRWLRDHAVDESTRETMEQKINRHVLPHFGHRQLGSIKPADVRAWDKELETVNGLAVSSRSVIFAHLRSIFMAAIDDERIVKNPCSAKSVKQPKPVQKLVVPWSVDQVLAIRLGLASRYRLCVDLGSGCGLRQGEIFGLSLDDVDFDAGWIHVRRQVKIVRCRKVFGLPKNNKDRLVPLPEDVAVTLKAHIDEVKSVSITLPWERPDSRETMTVPLLMTSTRNNAIKRTDFDAINWHPALRAAAITPTRSTGMHSLRHFYASTLLDAGESIKALASYLGHSDPAFTLRVYTHLMPMSETRTRKAINDVFRTAGGLPTAWEPK